MATLQRLVIEATFHPDNIGGTEPLFSFTGDINPAKEIFVEPGIAMIILNLQTAPTNITPAPAPAVFQTTPIQWFITGDDGLSTGEPTLAPHMFMFQRIGDATVTLIDFNSNQSDELINKRHVFNIVVAYDNKTYGSDPTIVNEPPIG